MKKLMMALAVVAVAAAAHANAVKWGASLVSPSSGTTGSTYYTAYLFIAGDTSDTYETYTVAGITAMLSSGDTSVLANAVGSANATSLVTTGSNAGKMTWTSQTVAGMDYAAGNTLSAFLIFVDDTESNYLVAQASGNEVLSKTVSSGTAAYNFTFNSQAANSNSWQAIPEPTSGILMLLGFAGLALRRKQK